MRASWHTFTPRLSALLVGSLCCAVGAVALVAGSIANLPRASAELGGFAFPDRAGTRLVLLGDSQAPSSPEPLRAEPPMAAAGIRAALCSGGSIHQVAFERYQRADGQGNGRQASHQFEHLDGLVFGLSAGARLPENEPCFLAAAAFAQSLTVVPVVSVTRKAWPPETPTCGSSLAKDLASRRQRAVANCWVLADAPTQAGVQVVLAEFARRGTQALATVVAIDGRRMAFADQPGTRRAETACGGCPTEARSTPRRSRSSSWRAGQEASRWRSRGAPRRGRT